MLRTELICTHRSCSLPRSGIIRSPKKTQSRPKWRRGGTCALFTATLACILTLGVVTSVAAPSNTQTTPISTQAEHALTSLKTAVATYHRSERSDAARQARICRRQLELHTDTFSSCQYPGAYATAMRNAKKKALVRQRKLHKPGQENYRDLRLLYWIANPAAERKFELLHMPDKQAFLSILREKHGYSEAEIQATEYIIEYAPEPENDTWNPWRAYGEAGDVTREETHARNGMDVACGIPQFKPCRVFGDLFAQADAYAEYVKKRYGGAIGAAEHKRIFHRY